MIQNGKTNLLFGTINFGSNLLVNMKKLGYNMNHIDLFFISQYQYGYFDGLEELLAKIPHLSIAIPYSFPESLRQALTKNGIQIVECSSIKEITTNFFTLGPFSLLVKEQILVIRTVKGLIIVIGPTHDLHIGTILLRVSDVFTEDPIYMVLCGFQLNESSEQEKMNILKIFQTLDVQKVTLCYCCDDACRLFFKSYFEHSYINIGVGSVIEINSEDKNKNLVTDYSGSVQFV